jgi:hypothetical protein
MMIHSIRDTRSGAPEHTVALCDGCGIACPESQIRGGTVDEAATVAREAALRRGYSERLVRRGRGLLAFTLVALLCPVCKAGSTGVEPASFA